MFYLDNIFINLPVLNNSKSEYFVPDFKYTYVLT